MTPTDRASKEEEIPWKEGNDAILEAFCRTGEDLLLTIDLRFPVEPAEYKFEVCRGEPPMPSDRFRVEARGNVVQLTLEHATRDDAGHYALMAKRVTHDNESERLFTRRIHMSIDEPSFTEDGDPPLFVRRLTDLTVKVGTRTRFLVEIKSSNDPKVTWHRNDEPIQAGPRFSFVHEGNFYCIDVAPVTVDDQGHWTCMAENRSGRSSCTSHLNVLVPKAYKRPEFISELRALLTETGTVSLECKVVGVPTPVLKWYKDKKEIKAGDVFALTANPDDPTSLGTYTCEAVNCMGTTYSSSRVHVAGKGSREGSLKPADTLIVGDPPIFNKILRDDCCRIGDILMLSCKVQVPPWPKEITWYNKEGRVEANERYRIMADGLGGFSIHINPVEAVDEGEWKCVATSSEDVKQFTTCYVAMSIPKNFRKPRFMESLKAILTEEGLVSFECKVVGFPTPVLKWFKDGQELKPGDVYQLTGTNSLGSYCCIAKNCMGEAKSTAELTVEDIQNQLNDEERLQLLTANQPPKFIKGLRSGEAKISESFKFSVQVSVMPEPSLAWYRDDHAVESEDRYRIERETLGVCHLEIQRLEFCDQAEWKCIASNDFGHSVTSCFLKLIIPKHYKKPKFLESLRALLSEGGAVNLECKVIGVPQPTLKWYKDGQELKPGDIHRIISGQDGTCCLGTYTCEASNCMGTVSSSAALLGFEDPMSSARSMDSALPITSQIDHDRELARNLSLSTIHEERTSQLLESAQTDHSATVDDRGEISFSFDGKEVSVSLYETPDLTEEQALQIVEMYADELSEHVSEHNVVELPPMRFVKESSTSGNLLMEAVVIDVSPDYFINVEDDLRTEADFEDISIIDAASLSSPPLTESFEESNIPSRPPRRKSEASVSKLRDHESESYHSAKDPQSLSDHKKSEMDVESEAFVDALSSPQTKPESIAVDTRNQKELRKRSISDVSSLETADSFDSTTGVIKKKTEKTSQKKRRLSEKESSEDSSVGGEKQKKVLESEMSLEDEDGRSSRSNKERLLDLLRHIVEPVLIIREALVDSDIILENENLINAFVDDNILMPIQNLCEVIAAIESKALQKSGDRSLAQNVRISILETIGGPTEELLRGLELMKLPENDSNIQTKLSILESLVDPVDEILFNLGKLEFELTGHNGSETPVIFERTVRTTERLGASLKEVNNQPESAIITALQKIHHTLSLYLESIVLNQFGGWTENIDAVLVESLARPLEDLERSTKFIFEGNSQQGTSAVIEKMSEAFNEIISRLDALVVALEGYESDYRTKFVVNLKTSLVEAAEELTKSKDYKQDNIQNLPEMILDPLIDAQTSVNSILQEVEKIDGKNEVLSLKTSELALSLVELRDAVSYVVHKTTSLRKDETISALVNLKEPLNDVQLALSIERLPIEVPVIKNILSPLYSIEKVMQTVIQHVEKSESDFDIPNIIKPILKIVQELQKQIPTILNDLEMKKNQDLPTKSASSILENNTQDIINNLQIASELSNVHFQLANVLEKCETQIGNIVSSPIFTEISDLRQSIGNAAVAIDKISSSTELNIDNFIEELSNLKEPLLKIQNSLLIEDNSLLEQQMVTELFEPLERLKVVSTQFSEEVIQSKAIISIIDLIDDIQKDITLQTNMMTKNAVEDESNIKSESYASVDFKQKTQLEKVDVKTMTESKDEMGQVSIVYQETHQHLEEPQKITQKSPVSTELLETPRPFTQEQKDKISDKQVIYPKEEFAFVISQSLNEIQQDISGILEEFEQESVTMEHPVSRLAESLENLRRTILVVHSNVSKIAHEVSDITSESSTAESHESAERISMSLKELLQPILEVREALAQTQDHKAPEVLLLNRLDQPIKAIEFNVLQLALEAHSHTVESDETSSRASLDAMARLLEDIEFQIPLALDEVNSRQEALGILRSVSKPLDVIEERVQEILINSSSENNLESDFANILNMPINNFRDSLNELCNRVESVEYHEVNSKDITIMLKHLIEPLVELQSSLSVIRSSRRTSVTETELDGEKKNVILRAIEEVRNGIDQIRNEIHVLVEMSPPERKIITCIDSLDSALNQVQNQIREATYVHPRSCLEKLPQKTVEPMQKLAEKIAVIEEQMDKASLGFILEPLEALWKQVQLAQMQFLQLIDQPSDEEAIIEGFLYPAKRLLMSLEIAKQNTNFATNETSIQLLQELEESTSSFGSSLFSLQNELIEEGADEKDSIIETLTAVLIPLNNIKNLITEISLNPREMKYQLDDNSISEIKSEESSKNDGMISIDKEVKENVEESNEKNLEVIDKVPTVLTTVETIVDEFIEVSQRETESLTTLQFASSESIVHREDEDQLKEIIMTQDKNSVETTEIITDRRDSITALWSLIQEPLNNLQQSISVIVETPSVIDEINKAEAKVSTERSVLESLSNLQTSISVMQQIVSTGSEQLTIDSWHDNSLPALQNLAISLEELGEKLPMLASQNILVDDHVSNAEELSDNSLVAKALKTLITPLHELKERLGLIVEEQFPYEQNLTEIQSLPFELAKIERIEDQLENIQSSKEQVRTHVISEMSNQLSEESAEKCITDGKKLEELKHEDEKIITEEIKIEIDQSEKQDQRDEMTKMKQTHISNEEKLCKQDIDQLDEEVGFQDKKENVKKLDNNNKYENVVKKEESREIKESFDHTDFADSATENFTQNMINNLQIASELSTVHFELATVLEKFGTDEESIKKFPTVEKVNNFRQSIGNASVAIDKISSTTELNMTQFIEELSNLKEPLFQLQNALDTKEITLQEIQILLETIEPLERLKVMSVNFSEQISQTTEINSILSLTNQIENVITLFAELRTEKTDQNNDKDELAEINEEKLITGSEQKPNELIDELNITSDKDKILALEEQLLLETIKDEKEVLKESQVGVNEKIKKAQEMTLEQDVEENKWSYTEENREKEVKTQQQVAEKSEEEEEEAKQTKQEEADQARKDQDKRLQEEKNKRKKIEEVENIRQEEIKQELEKVEKRLQEEAEECIKEVEQIEQGDAEKRLKIEEGKVPLEQVELIKKEEVERLNEEKQLKKKSDESKKTEEEILQKESKENEKEEEYLKQKDAAQCERIEFEQLKKEEKREQTESDKLQKSEEQLIKEEEEIKQKDEDERQKEKEKRIEEDDKEHKQQKADELTKKEGEERKQKEAEEVEKEKGLKKKEERQLENEEEFKREEGLQLQKEAEELERKEGERLLKEEVEEEAQLKAEKSQLKNETEQSQEKKGEQIQKKIDELQKKEEEGSTKKEEEGLQKKKEERIKKLEEEREEKESEELKKERELLKKEEESLVKKAEELKKKKEEEERLKKKAEEHKEKEEEEKERLKKDTEELEKKEAERLKKEEEERLQKEAAGRKKEEERLQKEAEERKKKQEERLQKEADELEKKEAAERLKKEEEERLQKEEGERKKKEEEQQQQKEEEERKKKEEERLKKEADELKKKEEAEQLKKEEEKRLKKEAEELKKKEEAERLKKEEEERLQKEEEEQKKKEEERLQKEAAELKKKEEAERLKKEEEERLQKEDEERKKKEEAERLKKEEEERLQKETDEREKKEEERLQKEADELKKKEEAERLKREEEERLQKKEEERKKKEEERLQKEAAELKKKEEAERLKKEEEERLQKEDEERKKKEEAERLKKEEEERLQKEADEREKKEEERLQKEADELKKKEEAERLKKEEEKRLQKEEDERKIKEEERLQKEAEERKKKEEAEQLKKEEEKRLKKEAEELRKKEEAERLKKEEGERLQKEEEERKKKEEVERLKKEEEERLQREADERKKKEERLQKEADELKKKEEAEKLKKEEEKRLKKEAEELQKKEEAEKLKKEEAERLKKEEEERLQKEEEERKKKEDERLQKEEEERKKKEEERLQKEAAELKKKEEAEQLKEEEEKRLKKEAEELKKKEEAERLKKEDERLQKEEEERKKKEEERLQKEAAELKKKEEAEQLKEEEEKRLKKEAEELMKREEAERLKKEEEERLQKEEEERKKKEEERLQKEAAELKKKEEAEQLKEEEEKRLKKEAEELKKKEEAERLKKEEERLQKEEEERKKKEEERLQKEAVELKKKEEAERLKKEEEERLQKEDEERKKKEEAERLKKEEEERLRKEEEERKKKKEEEEQLKKEEEKRLKKEAEKLKNKEEEERLQREEEERKKKEEAERLKKEEEERLQREADERKKKEEAEQLKKEEAERVKKEEERLQKEEEERKKKKEEEERLKKEEKRLKKEAEELKKKEEAERLKKEEKERQQKEEEERKKKEEAERLKKEEEERLQKEADERKKKEEERLQKEAEEHKKKDEAEKLKKEEERLKKGESEGLQKNTEELKRKEAEQLQKEEDGHLQKEAERNTNEVERQNKAEEGRPKKQAAEDTKKETEKLKKEDEECSKTAEEHQKKVKTEQLKQDEDRLQKEAEVHKKEESDELKNKQEKETKEEEKQKQKKAEKLNKKETVEGNELKNKDEQEKSNQECVIKPKTTDETLTTKPEESQSKKDIEISIGVSGKEKTIDKECNDNQVRRSRKGSGKSGDETKRRRKSIKKESENVCLNTAVHKEKLAQETNGESLKVSDTKLSGNIFDKNKTDIMDMRSNGPSLDSIPSSKIDPQLKDTKVKNNEYNLSEKFSNERPWPLNADSKKMDIRDRGREKHITSDYSSSRCLSSIPQKEIPKVDYSYIKDKNTSNSYYTRFKTESSYNKPKEFNKVFETEMKYDFNKSSLSNLSHLRLSSVPDLNHLRSDRSGTFLSKSREDLLRRDFDSRSSHLSLLSGTSIPDLTSVGKYMHGFELGRRYNNFSSSSLNLETDHKKRTLGRSFDNFRKAFEHPTYTPKSFHTSDYSLSVSDSLALSRSRRRFESRNVGAIYSDNSESKLFKNRILERGKCPTFCTRLTNCTVAEGSHVRLMCTTIGQPEPQVYWTKNGDRVRTGGREKIKYENGMATLEIPVAELEDSGYYACLAKNSYGQSSTEATVRVYSAYKSTPLGPTFKPFMSDKYKQCDRELVLETRVRSQQTPTISWLKDDKLLRGNRFRQSLLGDGICRLRISEPDLSDSGQYICKAASDKSFGQIRHMVHFDGLDTTKRRKMKDYAFDSKLYSFGGSREKLPRISSSLADHKVPAGGTIALQVEIKDTVAPKVTWFRDRGERREQVSSPKIRTFSESGIYTLIVPEATESEAGTYVCRVSNAYGHIDTSATVEVIPLSKFDDLGKPAMFVSRPADKLIHATDGEAVSVSFRFSGTPKPRVVWMKGLRDITDGPRSHKETIDDYVRLTLNRINPEDEGTYCILVKNCYGCDRSFFTLKVRQRARSLTPTSERLSFAERLSDIHIKEQESYIRNVPGPISSEPVVVDGGRNWLSLVWGKADRCGPAPVIAYRVDAWQIGGDGGARWSELGITPINSFDAFNLRPGGEYKFRITPRNRYGWGESVTMNGTATVCDDIDIPEFTKILPGQLKALVGSSVHLECEVRSDSKYDVKWLRESTEIDTNADPRFVVRNERSKCLLVLNNIDENDSGRYICEVTNKAGKVSSYARILVVNDPKILVADTRLKKRFLDGLMEDGPPQFAMRLRDRRVQTSYPVRLTCQVFGCPEPEVTWYQDGEKVIENATRSIYADESHFHTLEIARSTLEDAGRYTACAKNANGSVSCHCVLVVDKGIRAYIAPEFLYGLDVAYAVKVGGQLRLTAQIEAYPSVGIVWHRDGIRLRPRRRATMSLSHDGTAELVLCQVTTRDAGVYTCTATNEVGRAETTTRVSVVGVDGEYDIPGDDDASLHVVVNPPDIDIPYSKEPVFVTKPLSSEAEEGDTIVISCEVVGDPKPEVVWLRDFLKPDYYRDAPHFRRIGAGPQYSLEIPHAKLDYTGTYSVLAKNEHGEAKAVISLQIYAKGQGKSDSMDRSRVKQGNVLSVPTIIKELKDIRCCDGDAVTLDCKVYAPSEPPNVRWEKSGKIIPVDGDFSTQFDGETAKLIIKHVYPEDEGEYTCVATNELGKAYTSACLVVDVPEGKENLLSEPRLTRPQGLRSANSTPRSTPRSTPVRSLSPNVQRGRELKNLNLPRRLDGSQRPRRPKVTPPKFYTIPHNRVAEEGETVRFQCAVAGHPAPWCAWDKDGITVTSSARITVKEKDDVRTLEITDVTPEDAGLYRVTLENDYGRTEATARLEVIGRNTLTARPIRTRSASPRTYPTFSKGLLGTTTRLNGRLQLQCDLRGSPSPSTAWYRNGSRIERSSRVKKSFIGGRALLEISNVQYSDAGEYVCEAINLLGTSRSSCKVSVLDLKDPSMKDREAPKFLESLPSESIVMEGHSYELQARLSGTPPFKVTWLKDGHEVVDTDYYRHIVYEDGGIALRFLNVHPLDAGDYTCLVRNEHGEASSRGLFVVQDYKNASANSMLSFVKTPVPVFVEKGETACFCARVQSDRSVDVDWTINGKSVREDYRCKIERDGSGTSILRIPYVSQRDCGEIRCIVSISHGGPSISSSTQLRLRPTSPSKLRENFFNRLEPRSRSLPRLKDASRRPNGIAQSSSFTRLTSGSTESVGKSRRKLFNRSSADKENGQLRQVPVEITIEPVEKVHLDIQPIEKVHVPISGFDEIDESIVEILTRENIITPILADRPEQLVSIKRISSFKNLCPLNNNDDVKKPPRPNEVSRVTSQKPECEARKKEIPAQVVKPPDDVITLGGSTVVLEAEYQGQPEPSVKWTRAGRELVADKDRRTRIESSKGRSRLTLFGITADQAGKYAVAVENPLGTDCQFASVAVEGPPEPPYDPPSVRPLRLGKSTTGGASVTWCSPAYDGGCALTGYTVECRRVGEVDWNVVAENCHSLSCEASSLRPGASYLFRVRALNVHGAGEPSPESRPCRIPFVDMDDAEDKLKVEEDQANMEDDLGEDYSADKPVTPEEGALFKERYDLHEELGKGRYGVVRRVVEKRSKKSYAAKFVRTVKTSDRSQVREEMKIMNMLRHPKLLRLAAAFESPKEIVMVTEYISGGELFERVVADDFTLTEKDSILFMRQICEGVRYMHENQVVHLDLKPENIMCHTRTSHRIKLIDFGLAQILSPTKPTRVLFGTPEFIPPEIINYEPIGTESDMWSVGVICYVLLTGLSPFMGDNDAETFANIVRADYDFEDEAFDAISPDAKNFISNLLQKKKELRMSAKQCLSHSWLAQHTENMSQIALPTDKLKKFIVRRKWQKTGNALRALGRMAMLSANRRTPSLSPTSTRSLSEVTRSDSEGLEDGRLDSLDSLKDEETSSKVTSSKEKSSNGVLEKDVCEEPSGEESFEIIRGPEEDKTEVQDDLELVDSIESVHHEDVIDTIHEEDEPQEEDRQEGIEEESAVDLEIREIISVADDTVHKITADAIKRVHYDVSPVEDDETDESRSNFVKEDSVDKSFVNIKNLKIEEPKKNGKVEYQGLYKKDDDFKASRDLAYDSPRYGLRALNTQYQANADESPRLVEGLPAIRGRFLPTGNVSRTAKLFEKLDTKNNHSNGNLNNSPAKSVQTKNTPATNASTKASSERIQKAFAFWNK